MMHAYVRREHSMNFNENNSLRELVCVLQYCTVGAVEGFIPHHPDWGIKTTGKQAKHGDYTLRTTSNNAAQHTALQPQTHD